MDAQNRNPHDYYLFPILDIGTARLRLAEENGLAIDGYRFETLDALYGLAARTNLQEVA